MRLALNTTFREARADLARAEMARSEHQRALSSGRRINAVGDDPLAAANAIVERRVLAGLDSYSRASDTVSAKLSVTDSVLSDIVTQVTAAQSLVASVRSTLTTPVHREAVATALEGIRDTVLADVNTQLGNTFLFSGAATTTAPYVKDGDGVVSSYQGDDTVVSLDVGPNTAVPVSRTGDTLLRGADANDFFVELNQLIAAVRVDDQPALEAGMAALERQLERATVVQSRLGTDLSRLADHRSRLDFERVEGRGRLSRFEDADLLDAITGLQSADQAYQAALRAIGSHVPLSLFDFLR